MKRGIPPSKHVLVIGAGPGGLTAGMILARRGFKVTLVEKESIVGGRNGCLTDGPYRHDIGPTFLMLPFILEEVFEEAGAAPSRMPKLIPLDPMYELLHEGFSLLSTGEPDQMADRIEKLFPGEGAGFRDFMRSEKERFLRMYPCLQKDYSSPLSMLSPPLMKAAPKLSLGRSLHDVLSGYFNPEQLRISFTFQSKYLGMSPWNCPGAFAILSYIEYAYGIYHVEGGLSSISEAMASVFTENGGELRTGSEVRRILIEGGVAKGVEMTDGEKLHCDELVVNADFAHSMSTLTEPGARKKYTDRCLAAKDYSCSTFMLYLGLNKLYPASHHTIAFARDYRKNLEEIADRKVLSEDPSFYVRNASVTDPTLAPAGHSSVYVLVPVPNNKSGIDWEREAGGFRELVLSKIEEKTSMKGLRGNIVSEKMITPRDWEEKRSVYLGATFNLAHTLFQMLYFRPRNRFEEWDNCFLVGGGTHPGSGLPTIYESGRITANLISAKHGMKVSPPRPLR